MEYNAISSSLDKDLVPLLTKEKTMLFKDSSRLERLGEGEGEDKDTRNPAERTNVKAKCRENKHENKLQGKQTLK